MGSRSVGCLATPEELLTASHATCYRIGLRSLIARRGSRARRVNVTATVTADNGPQGIRVQSSHLTAIVDGLEGIDESQLQQLARDTEERCTISMAIRGTVAVSSARVGSEAWIPTANLCHDAASNPLASASA